MCVCVTDGRTLPLYKSFLFFLQSSLSEGARCKLQGWVLLIFVSEARHVFNNVLRCISSELHVAALLVLSQPLSSGADSTRLHVVWAAVITMSITRNASVPYLQIKCTGIRELQRPWETWLAFSLQCLLCVHATEWETMDEEKARGPSAAGMCPDEEPCEEGAPPRGKWANNKEFLLSMTGGTIGVVNLWLFPYSCYRYGGGKRQVWFFLLAEVSVIALHRFNMPIGFRCNNNYRNIIVIKSNITQVHYILLMQWVQHVPPLFSPLCFCLLVCLIVTGIT